ncbi:peptide chain release factor N(5)-glutamine methyltransferase [Candidatus Parcubacteria bacterium]|nr:peptide chain release factor N(5)-glutamine methyltransferase [Candidatus Parcubacteria bacterium]
MSQPIQYQKGNAEFFGRVFDTDPRALIPRFETEFLVSKTIEWIRSKPQKEWSIIDVGTGSGIIAISLALELPEAKITAIDKSKEALALARENALRHHVNNRINFIEADLLDGFSSADIILANLPYLPTKRISKLDPSVRDFEPHQALDGGEDGLEIYRRLFQQISSLNPLPKLCVFEFDDGQEETAQAVISHWLPGVRTKILKDSSCFSRYIILEN